MVTAPPSSTSTLHHIEVLLLQPRLVMIVLISTGSVTKRVFAFVSPIDQGLVELARVT